MCDIKAYNMKVDSIVYHDPTLVFNSNKFKQLNTLDL
jgi:hypothetical protein